MKKVIAVLFVLVSFLFIGCTKEFEYGSDKFYLETIATGGQKSTWYYFKKKVESDMIFELLSKEEPNGYELSGESYINGFWGSLTVVHPMNSQLQYDDPYISVGFCSYYGSMGNTKLNIYFNYTVASTGERKEEVWEVDFGQEPFEDKREK